MLCLRGRPQDEVGILNVCAYPSWGNLGNFESKCWPRDREVWTMLKKCWSPGSRSLRGAWIRMFHHLESTQNSQKFKLSSCNIAVQKFVRGFRSLVSARWNHGLFVRAKICSDPCKRSISVQLWYLKKWGSTSKHPNCASNPLLK